MVSIPPSISKNSGKVLSVPVTTGITDTLIIIIIIILLVANFSYQGRQMVIDWSLSDCKSPQACRNLFRILTELNNVVAWIVSIYPLISKFSSLFTNPLGIITSTQITIGITITFIFHRFLGF